MTPDLISRARAGDGEAFRALTEPHRRELQVHCYRMLGSLQDAEDALQDTLLAAWEGLDGFAERSSIRTWLYQIATHRCLNVIRAARRRPARVWDIPGLVPPTPTRLGEVPWIEPFPDAIFQAAAEIPIGPEARYEQTESISLAFVTALQMLPPRQLAVLVLRDVLGFRAIEVAEMLNTTTESVTSALKRARATIVRRQVVSSAHVPAPDAGSAAEDAIVERFVTAYEAADLGGLIALFTDDVFMSMPPMALEYVGPQLAGDFIAMLFGGGRRYRLVATRANGQPAVGAYVPGPDDALRASGLFTLTLSGHQISALSRFEPHLLPWFGLPSHLGA